MRPDMAADVTRALAFRNMAMFARTMWRTRVRVISACTVSG